MSKIKIFVFISTICSFLFLPLAPVYANTSVNVKYYAYRTPYLYTGTSCVTDASKSFVLGPCIVGQTGLMWSGGAVPVSIGQMVQINLSVYNIQGNNNLDAYVSRITRLLSSPLVYFAGAEYQNLGPGTGRISILGYISNNGNMSYIDIFGGQDSNGVYTWAQLFDSEAIGFESIVWWDVAQSGGAGGGNVQWSDLRPHLDAIQLEIRQKTNEIGDLLRQQESQNQTIVNNLEQINNTYTTEQQQAEQDGQQSQDDSEIAGADAEQATQSLISVIGDFFGAFINAQATTCVFNMGIILETVDLCSAYIPPVYNVILSIVSILMIVPMVLWLLGSISNAFREFQQ